MTSVDGDRQVHLVGSIPASSTKEALALIVDLVGDRVASWVPDGETGARQNWIGRLIENLRSHPDLEVAKEGDWSDYDSTPVFKVKKGHKFERVDLDYFEYFEQSWPEFQTARDSLDRPDLSFQIGIPGPIDVSFAAFGFNPINGLRYTRPFEDATVHDVKRIDSVAGDQVVYQLEIPIEVEVVTRIPSPARSIGVNRLAAKTLKVVSRSPAGTRWGIHLCVGDMNNKSFSKLEDAAPIVQLANALIAKFPKGRTLEFVHMPLAHGELPPSTEAAFYEPLHDLELPDGVRFIAGFAHEKQTLEEQVEIRDMIEREVGRTVDVASSCGLGRRDLEAATANLNQSRALMD